MEIKSNIEIATLHFVLILKKLGHISALRYVSDLSFPGYNSTHLDIVVVLPYSTNYLETNHQFPRTAHLGTTTGQSVAPCRVASDPELHHDLSLCLCLCDSRWSTAGSSCAAGRVMDKHRRPELMNE